MKSASRLCCSPTDGPNCESLVRPVMSELDSVRGLAILMVVVYHGFYWSTPTTGLSRFSQLFILATQPGWLGVNLFFVLSGFLITGILIKQRGRPGYYRNFYVRRALRILPACYGLLLVLAVTRQASWHFLAASFFYLANLTPLLGIVGVYGVLWSLAVEEHFYLVWPTVVRELSNRSVAFVAVTILILTPALRALTYHFTTGVGLGLYTWLVADGLGAGALLAVVIRCAWCTRARLACFSLAVLLGSAAATIAGAPYGILTRERLLGAAFQATIVNLGFTAFLALVLLAGTGRWHRFVNIGMLRFLGEISYGLYLYHLLVFTAYDRVVVRLHLATANVRGHFILIVLRFACATTMAVVVSYVSRRYFEEAFLRWKDRITVSDDRPIELGSAIPSPQSIAAAD